MDGYLFRMGAGLVLLFAFLFLTKGLARRRSTGSPSRGPAMSIRARHSLGARVSVVVMDVDGARLVLGVSPSSVNLLHTSAVIQVSDDTAVSEVGGCAPGTFHDVLTRFGKKWVIPSDLSKK